MVKNLERTLERLKEFKTALDNHDFNGVSLSNLPTHFWESLGESINDLEAYIGKNNDTNLVSNKYRKVYILLFRGQSQRTGIDSILKSLKVIQENIGHGDLISVIYNIINKSFYADRFFENLDAEIIDMEGRLNLMNIVGCMSCGWIDGEPVESSFFIKYHDIKFKGGQNYKNYINIIKKNQTKGFMTYDKLLQLGNFRLSYDNLTYLTPSLNTTNGDEINCILPIDFFDYDPEIEHVKGTKQY